MSGSEKVNVNLPSFPFALLDSTIQKNDGMYRPVLALITRLPCAVRIVNVQKMSGRDLHPFIAKTQCNLLEYACYALTYLLLSIGF